MSNLFLVQVVKGTQNLPSYVFKPEHIKNWSILLDELMQILPFNEVHDYMILVFIILRWFDKLVVFDDVWVI